MQIRLIFAFVLFVAVIVLAALSASQGDRVITRDKLVEMFDNITEDTEWDMSKPMLWGYFFTDTDKAKLERAGQLLQQQGYQFVDIFLGEKEESSEPDLWWLHVEKVEIHTPDTLHTRNQSLYQFADDQNLVSYDGMDVGPVGGKR